MTNSAGNFERFNKQLYRQKPEWMINEIKAFEEKTGIRLHVDNNVNQESLSEQMDYIKYFLDNNRVKGKPSAPDIYITNSMPVAEFDGFYLPNQLDGVTCKATEDAIYVRPFSQYSDISFLQQRTSFFPGINHENAHRIDLKGKPARTDMNIYGLKETAQKIMPEGAAQVKQEVIAYLNHRIENGELYVVEDGSKLYLRKYLKPDDTTFTQDDLDQLANSYVSYNGPALVPTAPLDISGTNLTLIDAEIPKQREITQLAA